MTVTSGQIQQLDGAMRQYYEAVYRASHAAYHKNFDLSARRAVISDQDLYALRDRVTELADPVNQATFTLDSYAARAVERAARERATRDTRGGVSVENGLRAGLQEYSNSLSKEVLAELDNYNAPAQRTRGGVTMQAERSHEELLAAARGGNTRMANRERAPELGGSVIPAAQASTPRPAAPQVAPLEQALRDVLDRGGKRDRRDEVMAILNEVKASNLTYGQAIPELRRMQQEAVANWHPPMMAPTGDLGLAADVLERKQRIELGRRRQAPAAEAPAAGGTAPQAPAAGGAAPAAPAEAAEPAAPSAAPRASRGNYETIDPAIQLQLEKLGHTTGTRNTQRFGEQADAARMDGLLGPKTKDAIKAVLGHEVSFPLNEATLAELNTKITEQLAARGTGQQPAAAAAPAAPANLSAQLQAELASVSGQSAAPEAYLGGMADGMVRSGFIDKLRDAGVTLTPEQERNLSVSGGIISSPDIARIETLLGYEADGKMDKRLESALSIPAVGQAVAQAFANSTVSGGAAVASNGGPGGTPGAGGERQRGA